MNSADFWPAFLLSFGLKETIASSSAIQLENDNESAELLFEVGGSPNKSGEDDGFLYPRSLCFIGETNDICVADTNKHRVKVYNTGGILKSSVGGPLRGEAVGEFDEPHCVIHMGNGNVAVADTNNFRIQLLRPNSSVKLLYKLKEKPLQLCRKTCSDEGLYALTDRLILYHLSPGKPPVSWDFQWLKCRVGEKFNSKENRLIASATRISYHASTNHIIVCDPFQQYIYLFEVMRGRVTKSFSLVACLSGLTMRMKGIALRQNGKEMVLIDALNNTVNAYKTNNGHLVECMLTPADGLRNVQEIAYSDDDDVLVALLQFSVSCAHTLKLYRLQKKSATRNKR